MPLVCRTADAGGVGGPVEPIAIDQVVFRPNAVEDGHVDEYQYPNVDPDANVSMRFTLLRKRDCKTVDVKLKLSPCYPVTSRFSLFCWDGNLLPLAPEYSYQRLAAFQTGGSMAGHEHTYELKLRVSIPDTAETNEQISLQLEAWLFSGFGWKDGEDDGNSSLDLFSSKLAMVDAQEGDLETHFQLNAGLLSMLPWT